MQYQAVLSPDRDITGIAEKIVTSHIHSFNLLCLFLEFSNILKKSWLNHGTHKFTMRGLLKDPVLVHKGGVKKKYFFLFSFERMTNIRNVAVIDG